MAAVVGAPDPKWGEIVVAAIKLKPGSSVDQAARKLDPIAVRIEDHRYPRHVSKCHRCKTLTHAFAS
jgi:acyl-coenzyme A synthetase/AMP-(fatty) acid ligase